MYYLLFILAYIGLYFTTSVILMNYEDFWDDSRGEIWTLQTMTYIEKIAYIMWYVPVFPFGLIIKKGVLNLFATLLINPLLVSWTLLKIFTKHKKQVIRVSIIVNSVLVISFLTAFAFTLWK